jgi:hypothetical protein
MGDEDYAHWEFIATGLATMFLFQEIVKFRDHLKKSAKAPRELLEELE